MEKVQTLKVKELLEIQGVKVTFCRYCSGNSCPVGLHQRPLGLFLPQTFLISAFTKLDLILEYKCYDVCSNGFIS